MFTFEISVSIYINHLSNNIFTLVESVNSEELKKAYNSCIKAMLLFRHEHLNIVTK